MPPRILFVSHTADWSGPVNSLMHLLEGLRGHYRVAVALPGRGRLSELLEREGIPFHGLPSLRKRAIPRLVRLIRGGGVDLVYGNNTSSGAENALIAARIAGVPFVCHARGMAWSRSWRQLAFLRFADAVVAVSGACAGAVAPYAGRRPVHVVHNGIRIAPPALPRAEARARLRETLGVADDAFVALSVGSLCARKGQLYAVHALAQVARGRPGAHLALVGGADAALPYEGRVRAAAAEAGLDGNLSLLGFRTDVPALLEGADCLVHTAVADPHPRVVLEAMAARLPVVAFATDGVGETVEPGRTGFLVAPGDARGLAEGWLRLMDDPALAAAMGEAARERVAAEFSTETTSRRVRAILEGVLGPAARGAAAPEERNGRASRPAARG